MENNSALGKHLIVDLWGEKDSFPFWSMDQAAEALKNACVKVGATVLGERWHHFGEGFGYTGVVVLAESHCTVHTWPELGRACLDVFMCGNCDPMDTLEDILNFYKSTKHYVYNFERGIKPSYISLQNCD
jgi:S-adenosylmethionine decarboxylase